MLPLYKKVINIIILGISDLQPVVPQIWENYRTSQDTLGGVVPR